MNTYYEKPKIEGVRRCPKPFFYGVIRGSLGGNQGLLRLISRNLMPCIAHF